MIKMLVQRKPNNVNALRGTKSITRKSLKNQAIGAMLKHHKVLCLTDRQDRRYSLDSFVKCYEVNR